MYIFSCECPFKTKLNFERAQTAKTINEHIQQLLNKKIKKHSDKEYQNNPICTINNPNS